MLPESAHQPELLCQIRPVVGKQCGIPQREEHARKLLILLYLHGGVWYSDNKPTEMYEFFPQKVFLSLIIPSEWDVCIWRFSCQENWADGVRAMGLTRSVWMVGGCGWTCHPWCLLSPQEPYLGVFPSVTVWTVSMPFTGGFRGICVVAAFCLSWPANLISQSFWKTVPSGKSMVVLTFGIENICHVTFTLEDS